MSTAPSPSRLPLLAAGLLGLTGIALGAFGAHALKATLMERGMTTAWDTGVKYHLLHAVALVALGAWARAAGADSNSRLPAWTAWLWLAGTVLFSGSLYWLAVGGPRWLGPVTPVGGIAFMAGWLLVAVAAFRAKG
ncbi:MAG: DUF423 domain-containing protein [Opitutaceae bacterium]|nr:DUF423 domain-containing protein [Opitutaceae bacterium]